MKILVLSGGAGVGKRTVGELVAKELGFPLLHNHLTANIAKEVYGDYGQSNPEGYSALVTALRKEIISNAFQNGLPGLIMTHANHSGKMGYLSRLRSLCLSLGIELFFVNLVCGEEERMQRFTHEERGNLGKSYAEDAFRRINEDWGAPALVPPEIGISKTIDTTDLSPTQVASMVIQAAFS